MSKETNTKQTSSQKDSHANPSVLQEREEERKMTAISGMKLLESSESVNLDGSLGKMLKALLTSPKVRSCSRYKKIWKQRVSKSNVLLFQLQASVRGIKGKGSGSSDITYPTPTQGMWKQDVKDNGEYAKRVKDKGHQVMLPAFVKLYPTPTQDSASERTKKYKQGGTPLTVAVKMFPTPTAGCVEGGEQSNRVEQTKNGGFILRKKNKPNMTFGAKLSDAMLYLEKQKTLPTPTARDHKDMGYQPTWKPSRDKSLPREVLKNNKPGGKLNPNFVEHLMAYPMNWTKIERTE